MYAIIDVETTGLSAKNEKITEIAIIIHDGEKQIDSFESLINPEKKIPYRITQITGINDAMLRNAPKFYEIAKKIIELTEDKILIGHNIKFDYSFLKSEFAEFNYNFKREQLDTVRLARKYIPGQLSYSLPKLTKALNIDHGQKHRAMGDALATSKLFELIISIDCQILKEKSSNYPAALSKEVLKEIPSKTGVYYFKDSQNNIIYVGKSNDIHSRIISHLNNNTTKKAVEMKNNIASIEYELTGSELIALLFESDEIKRLKPIYNRAQRRSVFRYGLFTMIDENGYIQLNVDKIEEMSKPLTSFSSAAEAKEFMNMVIEEYQLCQKLCGVYKTKASCFNYQIKKCSGACIGEESADDYNKRVIMLMDKLELKFENFYLFEKGRKPGEKSFIKVENGVYKGFGFIEETKTLSNNQLDEKLILKSNNRDVQSIINSWMRRNKNEIRIS